MGTASVIGHRRRHDWIDIGRLPASGTRLGRLIRLPLRLVPRDAVVRVLRGPLKGKRWIVGSGIHRLWLGSYEPAKMTLARIVTNRGDVVFDIGANVGIYTLLFSDLAGPEGYVVAFEPVSRNLAYLREHLRLNLVGNAAAMDIAISNTVGVVRFCSSTDPFTGRIDDGGAAEVKASTVDAVVVETRRVPRILKIDVEGAEADVLRGAASTLRRERPRVMVATHSHALKRSCIDLLRSFDYDVYHLCDGQQALDDEIYATPSGDAPPPGVRRVE